MQGYVIVSSLDLKVHSGELVSICIRVHPTPKQRTPDINPGLSSHDSMTYLDRPHTPWDAHLTMWIPPTRIPIPRRVSTH